MQTKNKPKRFNRPIKKKLLRIPSDLRCPDDRGILTEEFGIKGILDSVEQLCEDRFRILWAVRLEHPDRGYLDSDENGFDYLTEEIRRGMIKF